MRLVEFNPDSFDDCKVTAYLHTRFIEQECGIDRYPGIVICPGGAYQMIAEREAEPVALRYFAAGFQVFVLTYSVLEKASGFRPLMEASDTLDYLRRHAEEFDLDSHAIAISGFSAGGHLAASLATMYQEQRFLERYGKQADNRPDAVVLNYAVVGDWESSHEETIMNVSGGAEKGSEEYRYWYPANHVSDHTPPAFLWHTATDDAVSVQNSLYFAKQLADHQVPFEMHIFPEGGHGISVCTKEIQVEERLEQVCGAWVELSIQWLKRIFAYRS